MRRFLFSMVICILLTIGFSGCGGNNMDNLWKDTSGEGYPEINDDEFVPTFIRENEGNLNKLAEMMVIYNYDYDIYHGDDVYVIVREKNTSSEEKDRLSKEVLSNRELRSYLFALFELGYIEALVHNDADGESVSVVFIDIDDTLGPISRGARYIPEKVLNEHTRKEEYMRKYHVAGNWFYMSSGRT